jgi:hypothetical protein
MSELVLSVRVCDPTGWTVHVGDSPSNDGGGGDAGQFSNDAEAQLLGLELAVISNQMHPSGPATDLYRNPAYVGATGCTDFRWTVRDQFFGSDRGAISVTSPYALRIDPPSDSEGPPDALWYVGLNRTYGSAARTGTGATSAAFCLR